MMAVDGAHMDAGRAPAPVLRVSLFGGCGLSLGGREVPLVNKKAKAIVGYLAFARSHSETRERLGGTFWGDVPEKNARDNVRQTLKALRDALEKAGFDGHDMLGSMDARFHPGRVQFDVTEAIDSIQKGWPVDALMDQSDLAASLLIGFEDVSPAFNTWLTVQRASLAEKFARELQDRLIADPDVSQATARVARALFKLDPTHEPAARRIMCYLADQGDSAGAIVTHKQLVEANDEADNELSTETDALIIAIKSGTYERKVAARPVQVLSLTGFADTPLASALTPPSEKLTLIIGAFEQTGPQQELLLVFRQLLFASLAKFREWELVDGEQSRLPAMGATPCYTLSAPLIAAGNEAQLMLALKDSRTGGLVWAEAFDIKLESFFSSLREVVRQIATGLNVYISVERLKRVASAPDVALDIFDRWARGQWLIQQWQPDSRERTRRIFESIIADAPSFSPAHSGLAQLHNSDHIVFPGILRTLDVHQRALVCSQKAIEFDPLDSRAHLAHAWANAMLGHHEAAGGQFEQAISLNSNDAWTVTSASLGFAFGGFHARAKEIIEIALKISPIPTALQWCYDSNVAFVCGDYDRSIDSAKRSGNVVANLAGWHAAALAHSGRHDEARREAARFIEVIRHLWKVESAPTEERIMRWFLQCFPFRHDETTEGLRKGLVVAGLPGGRG